MEETPSLPVEVYNTTDTEIPVHESAFNKVHRLIAERENIQFRLVELVYVDEKEIVRINQEHLDRDYVTDIISFHYEEKGQPVEGTLYCCVPRIMEQAAELDEDPEREIMRIFIHGMLHLCGYDDQTEKTKKKMTGLENTYLELAGF